MARSPKRIPGERPDWNGRSPRRHRRTTSSARRWSPKRRTPTAFGRRPLADSGATAAALQHQFDDVEQQHDASTLGMWIFLVTEIMFFGGVFTAYVAYRSAYAGAFAHASNHLNLVLGTVNTAVLITSSLTMALAVHAAQLGHRRRLLVWLVLTM